MKKLLKMIMLAAVVLLPVGFGGSAFAVSGTCQIGYTGPDSNNMCTLKSTYTCKVTNKNDFEVLNSNNQVAGSGSVTSTGNTSTGSTTTGQASNTNDTTFNVSVDNSGTCTVLTTVPATPTPPVTPGKGSTVAPLSSSSTQTATVPAPVGGKGSVAVLPDTSSDSMLARIASVIAVLGVAGLASRLVIAAYRHVNP